MSTLLHDLMSNIQLLQLTEFYPRGELSLNIHFGHFYFLLHRSLHCTNVNFCIRFLNSFKKKEKRNKAEEEQIKLKRKCALTVADRTKKG